MKQMSPPSAQNQCTQRTGHAVELRIGPPHGIDPTIDGIRCFRADSWNTHGDRLFDTTFYKTADRKFGRGAPTLGSAHAVRERCDGADTRLPQPLPHIT